jgi:hypothetical protein
VTRAAAVAALAVAACRVGAPATRYEPAEAPAGWCRLAAGAYAYVWMPSTDPPLAGAACDAALRDRAGLPPARAAVGMLTVEAGAAIELPVELPPALRGMGCVLESVVLAHAREDVAFSLAIRAGDRVTPVMSYTWLPAAEEGAAVGPRALAAIQHVLGLPAPDRFSIVVGAGDYTFAIGVRPARESPDPPLRYRRPGADEAAPTQQVPQAAVVLSRCGRPASAVLEALD